MPNVFISYVRQNSDIVDKLAAELRRHGVTVWLDREQIMPGADWKYAIRQAIAKGDYFIACFSAEYVTRPVTYMNTEIGLAVEMLQQMPPGRIWFVPVLLSECEIPDRTIGGGQTLRDLQWEPLYENWDRGVRRILKAMGAEGPDILSIDKPIEFYSCFISYSTRDRDFAERLYNDLQEKGVRCWFAPENIQIGQKLREQIEQAVRQYDKLLLILSEYSMKSEWVSSEIYHARQQEIKSGRRKLFPVTLAPFETIRNWKAFDADSGKDMAREVREYFVPDFSNWKDHDAYQKAFDRLLRDLKAETAN